MQWKSQRHGCSQTKPSTEQSIKSNMLSQPFKITLDHWIYPDSRKHIPKISSNISSKTIEYQAYQAFNKKHDKPTINHFRTFNYLSSLLQKVVPSSSDASASSASLTWHICPAVALTNDCVIQVVELIYLSFILQLIDSLDILLRHQFYIYT